MLFNLLLWTLFLSFMLAKLEINIEGKFGWAEKLPTWKMKNSLTKLFLGNTPLTGYHVWMFSMLFLLYHFAFVIGLKWSLPLEMQIISAFLLFLILEDLFWFILNPSYGIGKFRKKYIPWHKNWLGPIPTNYILGLIIALVILYLSFSF